MREVIADAEFAEELQETVRALHAQYPAAEVWVHRTGVGGTPESEGALPCSYSEAAALMAAGFVQQVVVYGERVGEVEGYFTTETGEPVVRAVLRRKWERGNAQLREPSEDAERAGVGFPWWAGSMGADDLN